MRAPILATFASGGAYFSLLQYLTARYANVVVLTFGEVEDLLGFPLPQAARDNAGWWAPGAPGASPTPQSLAWSLAQRTAVPNLTAETVVFERITPGGTAQRGD